MALIIKKELDNGIVLENSYCRIDELYATKETLEFRVAIYKDKQSRISCKPSIEHKNYTCKHNVNNISENSIKQGYEYLKTLNEYINATDDYDY